MASVVNSIIASDQYPAFREYRIRDFTDQMIRIVRPLMNNGTNQELAYTGMHGIAEQAWTISCRSITSRLTFRYQFCDTGMRFSAASMDSVLGGSNPNERQAMHYRVRLCVTPVVTSTLR